MKVLYHLGRFPVVSETFVLRQIASLARAGHEVTILTEEMGDLSLLESWTEIDEAMMWVPSKESNVGSGHSAVSFPYIPAAVRAYGADGVVAWTINRRRLQVLFGSAPARTRKFDCIVSHFGHVAVRASLAKDLGIYAGKLVAIFHGADLTADFAKTFRMRAAYRYLSHSSTLLCPISHRWRYHLIGIGAPAAKVHVTRMGVPLNEYSFIPPAEQEREVLMLGSVGRLVEKKGFEYGIRAVKLLKDRGLRVRYHVVGDGPLLPSLQKLSAQLELDNDVIFHGALYGDAVRETVRACNVFLVPSVVAGNGDEEGLPVVLMEAMALGVPVVATAHSGIPELISHLRTGMLVAERDDVQLANAVFSLARQPRLCSSLALSGRKSVEAEFDAQSNAQQFESLLAEISAFG